MAATYNPLVYKTSGGDQLQVASGGYITMDSGATLSLTGQALATTGYLTASSGAFTNNITVGSLTVSSGSYIPVETLTSATVAMRTYGLTVLNIVGNATGATFTMAAATAAGQVKIICTATGPVSTSPASVVLSDTLIAANTTITFSTGATNRQYVYLVAQNTTSWMVVSTSTDVAFS